MSNTIILKNRINLEKFICNIYVIVYYYIWILFQFYNCFDLHFVYENITRFLDI